jgi:hypothetical protein
MAVEVAHVESSMTCTTLLTYDVHGHDDDDDVHDNNLIEVVVVVVRLVMKIGGKK